MRRVSQRAAGEPHLITPSRVVSLPATRLVEEGEHFAKILAEATSVPVLWSTRSLSGRFHISRASIYKAHAAGRLRGVRLLGTLRFLEADVLALLRAEGVPLGEGE